MKISDSCLFSTTFLPFSLQGTFLNTAFSPHYASLLFSNGGRGQEHSRRGSSSLMPKLTPTLILHQGPGSSLSSGIFENHPLDVWAAATLRNPSGCQVSWEDGPGSVCIGVQRALPPDVLLSRHCGKVRLTTGFLQLAFDYAGGRAGAQHAHLVFMEDPCLASTHLPLLGAERNIVRSTQKLA